MLDNLTRSILNRNEDGISRCTHEHVQGLARLSAHRNAVHCAASTHVLQASQQPGHSRAATASAGPGLDDKPEPVLQAAPRKAAAACTSTSEGCTDCLGCTCPNLNACCRALVVWPDGPCCAYLVVEPGHNCTPRGSRDAQRPHAEVLWAGPALPAGCLSQEGCPHGSS